MVQRDVEHVAERIGEAVALAIAGSKVADPCFAELSFDKQGELLLGVASAGVRGLPPKGRPRDSAEFRALAFSGTRDGAITEVGSMVDPAIRADLRHAALLDGGDPAEQAAWLARLTDALVRFLNAHPPASAAPPFLALAWLQPIEAFGHPMDNARELLGAERFDAFWRGVTRPPPPRRNGP